MARRVIRRGVRVAIALVCVFAASWPRSSLRTLPAATFTPRSPTARWWACSAWPALLESWLLGLGIGPLLERTARAPDSMRRADRRDQRRSDTCKTCPVMAPDAPIRMSAIPARRVFHHFTFYGFLLCFASTWVAAIYDNFLGWKAPYAYLSVPVVLGTLGGIGSFTGRSDFCAEDAPRSKNVDPGSHGPVFHRPCFSPPALPGFSLMLFAENGRHELAAGRSPCRGAGSICNASLSASSYTGSTGRRPSFRNALEQRSRDQAPKSAAMKAIARAWRGCRSRGSARLRSRE